MRPDTRARILATAADLGYDYGRLRSMPAQQDAVSVFCPADPHPNVPMLYGLLMEITERLAHHGFKVWLHNGHGSTRDPAKTIEWFVHSGCRGAIVLSLGGWAETMAAWPVPSVFLGPTPANSSICTVNVDDELGGRLVAEHFISLGHTRVGLVHMWRGSWSEARERGFLNALRQAGHEPPKWAIRTLKRPYDDDADVEIRALVDEGTARGHPLTGLFCDTDWLAAHALRIVRAKGLRVPEDLSIVGFDDAHFATVVDPQLTTVRQPFGELAALAAALLVEQMAVGERMIRSYSLPCELIQRGSSRPVGGDGVTA